VNQTAEFRTRFPSGYHLAQYTEVTFRPFLTAAAPSASYRVRKYVRRHRAKLVVAATIAGLLVAGTAFSSIQWLQAERARAGESEQRILLASSLRDTNTARQREREARAAAEAAQRQTEQLAYQSGMALAPADWERGSLTRLAQTLAERASYMDRGFEWYYWQGQLHQERRTIYPRVGPLVDVRLAADRQDIMVDVTDYRTYRLDATTGNVRAVFGRGPMSEDGRWIADGPYNLDSGTTIIDTTTGMRTAVPLPEQELALSPDGALLITTQSVWNVRTSTRLYDFKSPRSYDPQFSPDGQWFAGNVLRENPPRLYLRRASDGEPVRAAESIAGRFLGFTPDSRHLARWNGTTRQIHLLSTSDLSDAKQFPCEREPQQIAFSPDGTYVARWTRDATINEVVINELETGRWMSTYRVDRLRSIAFTHDGHELMAASWDGAVKFFPVESGDYIHIGSRVWNVQFNDEDASRLLLMTEDGARLIDVDSRKVLTRYANVGNAGIFPDGRRIATVPPFVYSDEKRSTKISIADEEGNEVDFLEYDDRVLTLLVAPDGQHIFVGAPGSSCSVLDAKTGEPIFRRPASEFQAFGFLPDGKRFAVVLAGESQIRFYDAATGSEIDSMRCEPDEASGRVQFSLDAKRLVTPIMDSEGLIYGVSIYDMATRERIQRIIGHAGIVYAAYFSPDGRRLFTKSDDGTVRLWDVETGFELLSLPNGGRKGEEPKVPGRALARDGRMLAIAGPEGVFLKQAATPEQVAAWQRPPDQPRDTLWWKRLGGVQDWLVLAPFHLGQQEDFTDDLDQQQVDGEANLDPRAGDELQVSAERLTWQQVTTSDCVLDFQKVTSPKEDHCLAYAVTHIYSDAPSQGVRLLIGSDDLAKIYLNGASIYESRVVRSAIPADDDVLIPPLRKGKNVLVCKVIDKDMDWDVSVQIVGEDYQPIPGVTTGLAP
jgi:WD40 repeat protein